MQAAPKIVFLANKAAFFVSHRLPVALAAKREGWEVHVIAPWEEESQKIVESHGLLCHTLPLHRGRMGPGELVTFLQVLWLYCKIKPQIVCHITMKPVIYGGVAAWLCRIPARVNMITGLGYAFIAPGIKGKLLRFIASIGYRLSLWHPHVRVLFQNQDDRTLFHKMRIIAPSQKTHVINGTGVDIRIFYPQQEPFGIPVIILPARMLWDKGVGEFVEAAAMVHKQDIQARFVLVGEPDSSNPASITVEQLNQWQEEKHIEWWGFKKDMPALYQQSHIVCLPSYREGTPRVLLEAAASGRAVVTTDVPGCKEVVVPSETGMVVPVKDSAALAKAFISLLQDSGMRQAMGKKGREMAEQKFSDTYLAGATFAVCKERWEEVRNSSLGQKQRGAGARLNVLLRHTRVYRKED